MEKVTIGNAELYCGNCLEILGSVAPDAIVTDPPYGIALKNNARGTEKKRTLRDYGIAGDAAQDAGIAIAEYAAKQNITAVFFASPRKPWPGDWRNWLVWDKGGAVGGGGDIRTCWKQTWELIQVARNTELQGARDESILRYVMTPQDSADHPAAKPVELMNYLIWKATKGTVFDPFMGSGSTGVAAMMQDRKFIGAEIDRRYFDLACERIQAAQAQGRLAI